MPHPRATNFPALPAGVALLVLFFALCSCRDQPADNAVTPREPIQLPVLDLAAWPAVKQPSTASLDQEQPVFCLIADGRVPFHRAQMQYLQHLDAGDARHAAILRDANGDAARQASQLAELQAKPPGTILIQPIDLKSVQAALTDLGTRGTTIIVLDALERPPPSSSAVFVDLYCDPQEIGKQAAALVIRALNKRAQDRNEPEPFGRLLEIRGSDASPWSEQVHLGFIKALSGQPGITLVHDAPAEWDPERAKIRYNDALRLQGKIDVVFAHDDFLAQAVHREALKSGTRDDTLIIGVNAFPGPEGGLEMLHRQEIDATVRRPWLVDTAWQTLNDLTANPGLTPKARQAQPPHLIKPSDLESSGHSETKP